MKLKKIATFLFFTTAIFSNVNSINAHEKITVIGHKPNNAITIQVYAVDAVGPAKNMSKNLLQYMSRSVVHSVPIDRENMNTMIKSSRANMLAVSRDIVRELVMDGTPTPLIAMQSGSFTVNPNSVTAKAAEPDKSHYDITVVPKFDGKSVKLTANFKAVEHLRTRFVSNTFQKTIYTENGGTVWYVTSPVSIGHGKSRVYAIGLTPLILIKHMGNRAAHDLIE